jgi:hypothetical protein
VTASLEALRVPGFWYVASPYSDDSPDIRRVRAYAVHDIVSQLLAMGCHVYSPIWATHRAAILYQLPKDHLFWLAFNKAFLDPAVGVLVADIDGWKTSKGTQQEIAYARATGKPVYLINDNNGLGPVTIAELPEAVA